MSRFLANRILAVSPSQRPKITDQAPLTAKVIPRFSPRIQQIRLLSDAVREAIDKAVNQKPVVLFMKGTPGAPQCGFSRATIQILGLQGVDPNKFAAFNVLEDPELRQGIKEYSEWPTIPQLYVRGEFIGGCDIVMNMHQSGELGKVLEEAKVLVPIEVPEELEETKATANKEKDEKA